MWSWVLDIVARIFGSQKAIKRDGEDGMRQLLIGHDGHQFGGRRFKGQAYGV